MNLEYNEWSVKNSNSYRKAIQNAIVKEMKTQPLIEPKDEVLKRVGLLKDFLKNSNRKSYILGISGGQDSTLAGMLTQMAINELNEDTNTNDYQFVAVLLPDGIQSDIQDAIDAAQHFIKADNVFTNNIHPQVEAAKEVFEKSSGFEMTDFDKGNLKARIRMSVQYSYSAAYHGFVIGTDHSAENITGFFTLWGDGAADIMPLFGLNKRQGREILEYLNCPPHLYNKAPIAGLLDNEPDVTDEDVLGVSYNEIDDFLEGREVSIEAFDIIIKRYFVTRFKRKPIPNLYNQD